jgi:hypothetical protein
MEKDFSYLENPTLLPEAYEKCLEEISRRREFYRYFEKTYKQLNMVVDYEKEKRMKFLNVYGRILP